MNGVARLRGIFTTARAERRAVLVCYLVAGFPDVEGSFEAASAMLDAGADVLEVGVPFSDPVADGPVIAAAARRSIQGGGGLASARELTRRLRDAGREAPLLLMTYRNPLLAAGAGFAPRLAADGIDGLVVPDLPAGEDPAFEAAARSAGLAMVFLVAPNTPERRLRLVRRRTTGFIYVVPRYGVTGEGSSVPDAIAMLRRVRSATGSLPIAAGFGIATAGDVRRLAPHADALIVGTALVRAVGEGGAAAAGALTADLAAAGRKQRGPETPP